MKQKNNTTFILYLLHYTLIYKIYNTISSFILYIKDKSFVSDTLYSNEFKYILKQYLHIDFETDWIGRLYSVINPTINIDGNIDFNNMIIELDDERTNNNDYVKTFIYKQMRLIQSVFKLENSGFFDYIGVDIRHIGPANQDNFLVIFDIVSRTQFVYAIKSMLKQLFIYIILALILIFFLF